MVDSPNGLAKYFLYVNYLVPITWVLLLALEFGAKTLDQYFPYKPDEV